MIKAIFSGQGECRDRPSRMVPAAACDVTAWLAAPSRERLKLASETFLFTEGSKRFSR